MSTVRQSQTKTNLRKIFTYTSTSTCAINGVGSGFDLWYALSKHSDRAQIGVLCWDHLLRQTAYQWSAKHKSPRRQNEWKSWAGVDLKEGGGRWTRPIFLGNLSLYFGCSSAKCSLCQAGCEKLRSSPIVSPSHRSASTQSVSKTEHFSSTRTVTSIELTGNCLWSENKSSTPTHPPRKFQANAG